MPRTSFLPTEYLLVMIPAPPNGGAGSLSGRPPRAPLRAPGLPGAAA